MKTRHGPDGIHLFDRTTGLNLLVDEVAVAQKHWATAPRQVSIALTNACDLACPFCYAPKHSATLPHSDLLKWVRELDEGGCLGVGFGGGEPTLYRRLPELCAFVSEHTQMAVTMTTHGHRWTQQLVEALAGSVNFVRVSVDGTETIYERFRGRAFADLRERVQLISDAFPVGINCVINETTVSDLPRLAALAADVNAAQLLLLPERPVAGRPGIGPDARSEMETWIRSYTGPVPLALGEGDAADLPIAEPLPLETGLRAYAHVDASGTAKRSSFSSRGQAIGPTGILDAIARLEGEAA